MSRVKMKEKKNVCGPQIKERRTELGITQAQLGARMQLRNIMWDQKTVSRLELQLRTVMDFELLQVANALECSVEQLLSGEKNE